MCTDSSFEVMKYCCILVELLKINKMVSHKLRKTELKSRGNVGNPTPLRLHIDRCISWLRLRVYDQKLANPLSPKSDQQQMSPQDINT